MIDMTKIASMLTPTIQSAYTSTDGGIPPGESPYLPVTPTPGFTDQVQEQKPQPTTAQAQDWRNLQWLKDYYGGRWYDFGAKEGQEGWWRAPRINPAGAEAVWNPKYGWQDWDVVSGLGGNYSSLTPQFGDVYKIFGGYNTNAPLPGGAPAGTEGWPGYPGTSGGGGYVPPTGGATPTYPNPTGVQYPAEWDTATNVLTGFAEGMPTDVPPEWEDMIARLNEIYTGGGLPVSQEDWYTQAKQQAEYDIKNAIDQANEKYTGLGLRFSTPAARSAQQIAGEIMAGVGTEWTGRELDALEAARARQMATLPYSYQAGAGIAGLEESAKDRGMAAANSLYNVGQGRWQMPASLANQAYQMGSGIYGQGQTGLQNMMNEWMRTQMWANPYLQLAASLGGQTGQYVPNQYAPGGLLGLGIC